MIQQQTKRPLPPLVKTITVPLSVEHAFRRFTEEIATWWPLETYSVGEKNAETVTFECKTSGQIFETLKSGKTEVVMTHSGWETFGEKAEETRGRYDKGWDDVLGKYVG